MKNRLSPSILAADFGALKEDMLLAEEAGAESFHFDIMDGHFVPNISYGADLVSGLRKDSQAFFDVHLMVDNPDFYFPIFKKAGADRISFHVEATAHVDRALQAIKELGMEAGLVLNPATPLFYLEEILPSCSYVLLMSVNPGFGGQKFIPYTLDKVERLRKMAEERGVDLEIGIDGGVSVGNIQEIVEKGANFIVAGSSVFSKKDEIKERVQAFHRFIKDN
jgi:ribulose-phosphate 3-epimerase